MTREELREDIEALYGQGDISYYVYSRLIDGVDTLEQEPCDCGSAYHDGNGCLGYSHYGDDFPIEQCLHCPKYMSYEKDDEPCITETEMDEYIKNENPKLILSSVDEDEYKDVLKPCDDAISREAVSKWYCNMTCDKDYCTEPCLEHKQIMMLPSVQPKPIECGDAVIAEIDKQYKWLMQTKHTLHDIADMRGDTE